MKNGWQTVSFGELGRVFNGNSISKAEKKAHFEGLDDGVPYIGTKDISFDHFIEYESGVRIPDDKKDEFKLALANTVLVCAEGGSAGRKIAHTDRAVYFGNKLFAICPTHPNSSRFVFYYCLSDAFAKQFKGSMAGLIGGVSLNKFKELSIALPPVPEQRRIVGILDQAFEGIATAKANAEKNLQNAHALFVSHLQSIFTQHGKDWVNTTLEAILAVQPRNGWSPPAAKHSASGTPVLTLSSVTGFDFKPDKIKFTSASTDSRRHYWVKNGDFLITRSNTPELVGHVAIASGIDKPTIYPDLIMRMNPASDRMMTEFLYYQMRSPSMRKEITGRAQGANPTMKKISNGAVKTLPITMPSLDTQRAIVQTLNALTEETQRLESLYQRKLSTLDELKKSLLHQAFTGRLTAGQPIEARANVIPFPITLPNITTTDLHAGVLAMAYEQHREAGNEAYFTHVKAEKIAHMVEAHLGLDLGRAPVKDAAGPNDFPHLKKVEHRARKANYFDFRQVGTVYRVRKLGGFERLIGKTHDALGDRYGEVERLLRWMRPMTVQQAEITATVFAAWNNLLLDGMHPTDERIVLEARENWHPDKLKIPRPKFFAAVQWLREQGRVPEGKGRRVAVKGS